MKEKYDIIVVGGSSAGSYFAEKMAKNGFSVLMIEKSSRENLNTGYDIFHFIEHERNKFDLPEVKPGDGIYEFKYNESYTFSPYGNHVKFSGQTVIGMHRHEYMLYMNDEALKSGVDIEYNCTFKNVIIDNNKIIGVTFIKDNNETSCSCKLCVDCSGISSCVRRSLPDSFDVEKFDFTSKDVFFVNLYYIRFKEPLKEKWNKSHFYMYYKSWLAPCGDDADCIMGIGSSNSYEAGEETIKQFIKNVKIPEFEIVKTERGITPYHRPLYSFVENGFIAFGDAASVTKANNGEGCIAQLPLENYAIETITEILKNNEYPTREKLWEINKKYYKNEGKDSILMLAALTKALYHSIETNEYLFEKDTIFNNKILSENENGDKLNAADVIRMLCSIIKGIATKKIKRKEICDMFSGGVKGIGLFLHYMRYPKTPEKFDKWVKKSNKMWDKIGQMSDWVFKN